MQVLNTNGEEVDFEILPVFDDKTTISKNNFQLSFVAEMEPLEIRSYRLQFSPQR